ncbi:uncharacterized protein LOC126749802 [Anthonomus grandis grandis]|uniref:uncharacterized protein LOC126749802 n=1 Tax=Anthonomus grandis grandis TaxID=2921223 RepID=UPI0021656A56|nr:uncharacterized protein LOC126749802 [Anthonomus grandis grandis]
MSFLTPFNMLQKIIIITLALTGVTVIATPHLTKELEQPNPEADQQLAQTQSLTENLLELLVQDPQAIINNLAALISNTPNPGIEDVLEAINGGVGAQVFIVDDDLVQLNPDAFENAALKSVRKLSKVLYPKSLVEQIIFTSMAQQRVKSAFKVARPIIIEQKIPVQVFELALRNSEVPSEAQRALVQQRDILTDLMSTVQDSVCNTLVATLYNTVNSTLTDALTFLQGITISTSDSNVLTTLLSTVVEAVLTLVEDLVSSVDSLAQSLLSPICSSLTSDTSSNSTSRKRREVEVTALDGPLNRSLATRGILDSLWSLIWSLLSPVLNALSTSLVQSFVEQIQTYADTLIDSLAQIVYDFIDSVF